MTFSKIFFHLDFRKTINLPYITNFHIIFLNFHFILFTQKREKAQWNYFFKNTFSYKQTSFLINTLLMNIDTTLLNTKILFFLQMKEILNISSVFGNPFPKDGC